MKELPIACTLDAASGVERIDVWRRLGEQAQLGAELRERTLVVSYRASAADELTRLIQAERSCCSFLDWTLEQPTDRAVLRVRAGEGGEPELERLADLFGALRRS